MESRKVLLYALRIFRNSFWGVKKGKGDEKTSRSMFKKKKKKISKMRMASAEVIKILCLPSSSDVLKSLEFLASGLAKSSPVLSYCC